MWGARHHHHPPVDTQSTHTHIHVRALRNPSPTGPDRGSMTPASRQSVFFCLPDPPPTSLADRQNESLACLACLACLLGSLECERHSLSQEKKVWGICVWGGGGWMIRGLEHWASAFSFLTVFGEAWGFLVLRVSPRNAPVAGQTG